MIYSEDHASILEAYNLEYREELINKLNARLGYYGVYDAKTHIIDRDEVDWDEELQPKYLSLNAAGISPIKTSLEINGFDPNCEPQIFTNPSRWCKPDSALAKSRLLGKFFETNQGVSGFKRNDAQEQLKKEELAFVDNNDMVYIELFFTDPKAYFYSKTLLNVVEPSEIKQPNSPSDIVRTLNDAIESGVLDKDLLLNNIPLLKKEVRTLTPDKKEPFRTEVVKEFLAGHDKKYLVFFKGNLDRKLKEFNLPKNGEEYSDRDSHFYSGSSGEMKTTWFNAEKKIYKTEKPIDFSIYVGIPNEIYQQRLFEIKGYINVLMQKAFVNGFINHSTSVEEYKNYMERLTTTYRFLGFFSQCMLGIPKLNGKNETELYGNIIRHPYNWFCVESEKEMKQFLKENTTSISTVINPSAIDDEVNELYDIIMMIHKNSIVKKEKAKNSLYIPSV